MLACCRECTACSVILGSPGFSFARQWNSSEGRPMTKNPILEELYAVRSQILTEHGDHLAAYMHLEFERLKAAGHPVAQIKQRTIRCTGAARSGASAGVSRSSPPGGRDRKSGV